MDQEMMVDEKPSTSKKRQATSTEYHQEKIPIVDLSVIEKPMIAKNRNTFHVCSDRYNEDDDDIYFNVTTPEPIVEIYSDSDDNESVNFENFEKNIFNEINKRATIRNRMSARTQAKFYNSVPDSTEPKIRVKRNSSAQTIDGETKKISNVIINENKNENKLITNGNVETILPEQQKLQSTSKIIIERISNDKKDKKEIILYTDIDKDGKVRRTTEIRNHKQKLPSDLIKIENEYYPTGLIESSIDEMDSENKNISAQTSKQQLFPRTQSAFDLTDNDVLAKTDDDFISNKALSSLDISSKSPAISEGYHSERMDSHYRSTTPQNYVIKPPEMFRETPEQEKRILIEKPSDTGAEG